MENKQRIFNEIPFINDLPAWLKKVFSFVLAPMLALMSVALTIMLFVNIFGFVQSSFMGFNAKPEDLQHYTLILAGFLGAPFIVWQTATAHYSARTEENRLVSERLTKAYEQLGAERIIKLPMINKKGEIVLNSDQTPIYIETVEPDIGLRRAAIQTLKNIAINNKSEHIDIMESLCAYIRENAKAKKIDGEKRYKITTWYRDKDTPMLREDIQEALVVIGSRSLDRIVFEEDKDENGRNEIFRLDLSDIDIRCARLKNLNFIHAFFRRSDLSESDISETSFESADLTAAKFIKSDITKSNFKGTDLKYAQMDGVCFKDMQFRCDVRDASFEGAAFRNIDISIELAEKFSLEIEKVIRNSFGDGSVKLPDTIKRPAQWVDEELDDDNYNGHLRGWLEKGNIAWVSTSNLSQTVLPIPPKENCDWTKD